jgi:hypothetical protein
MARKWDDRGTLVPYQDRVAMVTGFHKDGTLVLTFNNDGLRPKVAYRVPRKDVGLS